MIPYFYIHHIPFTSSHSVLNDKTDFKWMNNNNNMQLNIYTAFKY